MSTPGGAGAFGVPVKLIAVMVLLGAAFAVAPAHESAADIIDNDANALILANRANGLLTTSRTRASSQQQRRALQGSSLGTIGSEASCGGIALGNVRPVAGDHRKHETTVIVQGNIVNANNSC